MAITAGYGLKLWRAAYNVTLGYIEQKVEHEPAVAIVSKACGYWLQGALDGIPTVHGPYWGLLSKAAGIYSEQYGTKHPEGSKGLVLPDLKLGSSLPYDLAYMYCDLHRMACLAELGKIEIHRIAKVFANLQPVNDEGWTRIYSMVSVDLVAPLVRRALRLSVEHQCTGCVCCEEFGAKWDTEDEKTSRWLTDLRMRKEAGEWHEEER